MKLGLQRSRKTVKSHKRGIHPVPMEQCPAYILDIGSCLLRGGFSGDTVPRVEATLRPIPTISIQKSATRVPEEDKQTFRSDATNISYRLSSSSCSWQANRNNPVVKDGRITDWRCLQRLLGDCFTSMSPNSNAGQTLQDYSYAGPMDEDTGDAIKPYSAVVSMSSFTSSLMPLFHASATRTSPFQQLVEWMFGSRGIQRCQLVSPALMSLYGVGLVSGIVVDVGHRSSRVSPIAERQSLPATASTRFTKGGEDITEGLERCLAGRRVRLATPLAALEQIKREACFVSQNLQRDLKLARETSVFRRQWTLPDGSTIILDEERFTEPEALFTTRQHLHGFVEDGHSLPNTVGEAIRVIPLDLRRPLLKSVLLVGGGSLLPGFAPRLEQDIRAWYSANIMGRRTTATPADLTTKLIAPPDRHWLPFRGSSLHAELTDHQTNSWITKEAYEESGIRAFQSCAVRNF